MNDEYNYELQERNSYHSNDQSRSYESDGQYHEGSYEEDYSEHHSEYDDGDGGSYDGDSQEGSYDDSYGDTAGQKINDYDHPASELYNLCFTVSTLQRPGTANEDDTEIAIARKIALEKWQDIRVWFSHHTSPEERIQAAEQVGKLNQTALHLACLSYDPPLDVIVSLIECCPESAMWENTNSFIPLHIACANGASREVIEVLLESYPVGKFCLDRRGRTPLHFAIYQGSQNFVGGVPAHDNEDFSETIRLLSEGGAAEATDEKGWLPLHYACAFGTTAECLKVLLDAHPLSIKNMNSKGQTALHLAMVNAKRAASPEVVDYLLSYIRGSVRDGADELIGKLDENSHSAISLLVDQAGLVSEDRSEERKNISECLTTYLNYDPPANMDLLSSLQSLPDWLRYPTVINENVQQILNHQVAQRFPTFILLLDFYMLLLMVSFFPVAGQAYIKYYFALQRDEDPGDKNGLVLLPVFIPAVYFLAREVLQVLSIINISYDKFKNWYTDSTNWVDVMVIFIVIFFSAAMWSGFLTPEELRTGIAFATMLLWFSFIIFIKSIRVEFAVFVDGLVFVLQKLSVFMISLFVILVTYAVVMVFMYRNTPDACPAGVTVQDDEFFAHCSIVYSCLRVYTMLIGEVEAGDYEGIFSTIIFISFVFLVVILLGNVLIAIVTDSYAVIQDERAEMVFWSNRLDFVAEIAGLTSLPFLAQLVKTKKAIVGDEETSVDLLRDIWKNLVEMLLDDRQKKGLLDQLIMVWFYGIACFVIPIWILLGFASMGLLLPPQVREMMLVQSKTAARKGDKIVQQFSGFRKELDKLRGEIYDKVRNDDYQLDARIMEVRSAQTELMSDLLQVKDIMGSLLNLMRNRYYRG